MAASIVGAIFNTNRGLVPVAVIAGPFGSDATADVAIVPIYSRATSPDFEPGAEDFLIDFDLGDVEWWAASWNARTIPSAALGVQVGMLTADEMERLRDLYFARMEGAPAPEYEIGSSGADFQRSEACAWNTFTLGGLVRDEQASMWGDVAIAHAHFPGSTILLSGGSGMVFTHRMLERIKESEGYGAPIQVGKWYVMLAQEVGGVGPITTGLVTTDYPNRLEALRVERAQYARTLRLPGLDLVFDTEDATVLANEKTCDSAKAS